MDTTVAELGIACEACHGPGAEHVRANRDPRHRYAQYFDDSPDPSIVNPARLDAERSSQVCGQCHGIHRPRQALPRESRLPDDWRDHGLSYRPGEDLEDHRYLVQSSKAGERRFEEIRFFDPHLLEDRFWSDGMVRVSGREYNGLVASPCFVRGTGERRLGCSSCHRMHPEPGDPRSLEEWAEDQLGVGMDGNGACLQCHERFASERALASHSHHETGSSGSLCANCHMPYTTYGLLKAIRSHTIDSPDLRVPRDTGRPLACNLCHLDKGMGWTRRFLQEWYDAPDIELPPAVSAVPSSLMWLLSGDAGQRALAAWAMGWDAAIEASSTPGSWMAPFLAQLLVDPYDAVRYIAVRSLRRQPGFEDFEYDYMAPQSERERGVRAAKDRWQALQAVSGAVPHLDSLLDDPKGELPPGVFEILYRQRNDGRVSLAE
jgi:hypothetical protein